MAVGPLGLVPRLVGNPLPLQLTPEGAAPVTVQPAIPRLTVLRGMVAACKAAMASGMLFAGSPPRDTVAGLLIPPKEFPTV